MAPLSLGPWSALTTLLLATSNSWLQTSNAATISPRATLADGVELRVLPIGDSITYGAGSPFCGLYSPSVNCNGYRKPLYEMLTKEFTNKVDFVGKLKAGNFDDLDNEGYRGEVISDIAMHGKTGIYKAPNIVLMHVGTNDVKEKLDLGGAPDRIRDLIDSVFEKDPKAAVFLCKIIPASTQNNPSTAKGIPGFNEKIPGIVNQYVSDGKKVFLVDMNKDFPENYLSDGLHPSTDGYKEMADRWLSAIKKASADGAIAEPGKASDPPTGTGPDNCRSTPSWYNRGQIADGASAAYTDGDFKPSWSEKKVIHEGGHCDQNAVRFMDLNGDGYMDYACVDDDTGAVWVSLQIPLPPSGAPQPGTFAPRQHIASGATGRKGSGVMFADLNGDGRDDYIYVDNRNGAVAAWINSGPGDKSGDPYKWKKLGIVGSRVGATTKNLQMADINGDGRADFCIISPTTGEMTAWLNTGGEDMPDYYKLGVVGTGASVTEDDKVLLGDFTGNGRADYMIVGKDGKVNGLVNRLNETSLAPRWLGVQNIFPLPDDVDQDSVRLVDMNGDGKVDYVAVGQKGKLTYWGNQGTGGKYQKGEGVRLCDLNGDGTMDYFWLDHDGKGWGYLNMGKGENVWYGLGNIAKGVGEPREKIRMAVLTKSRRADYVVVEEVTGEARWWQNLGEEWDYNFASRGIAATGPGHTIRNQFNWTFKAANVRFADLDGDGLDDYIYVNEKGAVVYWKNLGNGDTNTWPDWGLPHLVADGVGVLPQDIRFADSDGGGFLDYIVVGRVTGRTRTWHNLGFRKDQSIMWNTPLSFTERNGTVGHSVQIAEMTGDDRADYVSIDPDTGRLNLWENRCWPASGDDPEDHDPWGGIPREEWCEHSGLIVPGGFPRERQIKVWGSAPGQFAVGEWLDKWLRGGHSSEKWFENLLLAKNDTMRLDNIVCNNILDKVDCYDIPSCYAFYDHGLAPLYWIVRAVTNIHRIASQMEDSVVRETIGANLEIAEMIETFGHPEPDTSALDIFITAMSGGAALSSAYAPISGAFSGIGAIATLGGQLAPKDEPNDRLDAENVLDALYHSARLGLQAFLGLSVDGLYIDHTVENPQPLHVDDLPNLDGSPYHTTLAKHFQGGRWLIDVNGLGEDMRIWQGNFTRMARQSISSALLRAQKWFVFINADATTKELCEPATDDDNGGRRWVEGMCFETLLFLDDEGPKVGFTDSENSNVAKKLAAWQDFKNGGLVLEDLYRNSLDCALRYPNGDGRSSAENIQFSTGDYPICFFGFPVVRAGREVAGNRWKLTKPKTEPFINTSGRLKDWN